MFQRNSDFMNVTIDDLFQKWAEKCQVIDVSLVKEGCRFFQELKLAEMNYPSSMEAVCAEADSAVCFAIRHKAWLATFWGCFTLNQEKKIVSCSLSWDVVDNATIQDIPTIDEKGHMAWQIFRELFEEHSQ